MDTILDWTGLYNNHTVCRDERNAERDLDFDFDLGFLIKDTVPIYASKSARAPGKASIPTLRVLPPAPSPIFFSAPLFLSFMLFSFIIQQVSTEPSLRTLAR